MYPPATRYTWTWGRGQYTLISLLPHHLVLIVDEVSAPVVESPLVEAGQVLNVSIGVVDRHPGLTVAASTASS